MEFGLEKCTTLTIHRGEVKQTQAIGQPNKQPIKGLSLEEIKLYIPWHSPSR